MKQDVLKSWQFDTREDSATKDSTEEIASMALTPCADDDWHADDAPNSHAELKLLTL